MTAISKSWVAITDAQVDPDSPLDTALITGLRDDLIHLREWMGASFTGGAVQDHSHDGVNSTLVEVGPNALRNGSFENGLASWASTAFTGGTIATNTANHMDGATAVAITSTSTANGGGQLDTGSFIPVTGALRDLVVTVAVKASVANVSSKAEVVWYDNTQAQISVATVYSSTNTPTTGGLQMAQLTPPSTARFYKVRLTGGVPASGSSAGTIYFDGAVATFAPNNSFAVTAWSPTTTTISGIPSAARVITVSYDGIGTISGGNFKLQPGNASGVQTTGYVLQSATTTEVPLGGSGATQATGVKGVTVLTRIGSGFWAIDSHTVANATATNDAGTVAMAGVGDITTLSVSNNVSNTPFGNVAVRWEL